MSKSSDLKIILNGLLKVANTGVSMRGAEVETCIQNSNTLKAAASLPETLKRVNELN